MAQVHKGFLPEPFTQVFVEYLFIDLFPIQDLRCADYVVRSADWSFYHWPFNCSIFDETKLLFSPSSPT